MGRRSRADRRDTLCAGDSTLVTDLLPSPEGSPLQPSVGARQEAPPLAVRAAGSSVWSIASQVLQVSIGMGSFAVLSHWLTPYDYGLFGMAATATAFVGVLGDVGVTSAVIRLPEIDDGVEATAFWMAIGGALILTALTAAAAPLIAKYYRSAAILPIALGLALNFVLAAPGRVPTALLSRRLRFRVLTITGITSNALAAVGAITLAAHGYGAWALVAQMLFTMTLSSLLTTIASPPRVNPRLVSRARVRDLAGVSSQLSGFSFATMVGRSLDNVLAGRLIGSAAVGLMTMGVRLVFFPIERLCGAIHAVFLPASIELRDISHQANAYRSTLRLLQMVVTPFCLGIFAIAPEIAALLPPKWATLAAPLRVYALTSLILPLNYLSLSILISYNRAKLLFRMALTLIPICWVGALLGALSGSVVAMVVAWSVGVTTGACVMTIVAWRQLGLTRRLWVEVAPSLGASLTMAVAVWAIVHALGLARTRTGFVVGAVVGMVLYLTLAKMVMSSDVKRAIALFQRALPRKKGIG